MSRSHTAAPTPTAQGDIHGQIGTRHAHHTTSPHRCAPGTGPGAEPDPHRHAGPVARPDRQRHVGPDTAPGRHHHDRPRVGGRLVAGTCRERSGTVDRCRTAAGRRVLPRCRRFGSQRVRWRDCAVADDEVVARDWIRRQRWTVRLHRCPLRPRVAGAGVGQQLPWGGLLRHGGRRRRGHRVLACRPRIVGRRRDGTCRSADVDVRRRPSRALRDRCLRAVRRSRPASGYSPGCSGAASTHADATSR